MSAKPTDNFSDQVFALLEVTAHFSGQAQIVRALPVETEVRELSEMIVDELPKLLNSSPVFHRQFFDDRVQIDELGPTVPSRALFPKFADHFSFPTSGDERTPLHAAILLCAELFVVVGVNLRNRVPSIPVQ